MSSDVLFETGDLVEYTRELPGMPQKPEEMRLRAIVRGLRVTQSHQTDEKSASIFLYEGRHGDIQDLVEIDDVERGVKKSAKAFESPMKPRLVSLDLDYFISLEPEVVRSGNSMHSIDEFIISD